MRLLAIAATAAVALTLAAAPAPADDRNGNTLANVERTTIFDLGIDVTDIGRSTQAVKEFLTSLTPDMQRKIVTACGHYVKVPLTATEQETLAFCSLATGG